MIIVDDDGDHMLLLNQKVMLLMIVLVRMVMIGLAPAHQCISSGNGWRAMKGIIMGWGWSVLLHTTRTKIPDNTLCSMSTLYIINEQMMVNVSSLGAMYSKLCIVDFTTTFNFYQIDSVNLLHKMSEKLCLQWNDFKENATSAFGTLREDNDFADVTLACEDGKQFEAHKVILATSSPFFQNILRRNKHTHPLIYMRGLKSEDLAAIIDFLYCGEANVYQENLDSFLAIAEELQLKGLTGKTNDNEVKPEETHSARKMPVYKKQLNLPGMSGEPRSTLL